MWPLDLVYYALMLLLPLFGCFILLTEKKSHSNYPRNAGFMVSIAKVLARSRINKLKEVFSKSRKDADEKIEEQPKQPASEKQTDTQTVCGIDQQGNRIFIKLILHHSERAEVTLFLQLENGTRYILPNSSGVLICSIQKNKWKAEGLSIYIIEPYRRIRIVYNGLLQKLSSLEQVEERQGNVRHVKFNFVWNASDKPIFHPQDTPNSLLLNSINAENWKTNNWLHVMNDEQSYEQYGALQGIVSGEDFADSVTLHLPCFRQRLFGIAHNHALRRNVSFCIVGEDGTLFSVGAKCYKKDFTQLQYGSLLDNIGNIRQVTSHDIDLENLGEHDVPDAMTIHVVANKKTYKCAIHFDRQNTVTTYSDALKGWEMNVVPAKCMLGNQKAVGLATFWWRRKGNGIVLPAPLLVEPELDTIKHNFVAPFSSRYSCITSLAGGKGSSLGLLSSLQSQNFIVPKGFVVLSTAFHYHVKQNPKLQSAINDLTNICRGKLDKNLTAVCLETVGLFTSTTVDEAIAKEIVQFLNDHRQGNSHRWAVRSSGVNEDSEELSAAGQNATILGCSTNEDVLKAVASCWGSLFTFQSVEYRRQHSIDINTGMGVVIQNMVNSEKAGVLFTNHPTNGDPSKMVITSNFGIGESVVSGDVDPDTIVVNRTWDGILAVHSQEIGSKKHQVNISNSGVQTVSINKDKSSVLSLSNKEIIHLGNVGLELEKAYGSPRDIEWAFYEGNLFLLQSRPITTLNTWTDFELLHEFDSPVVTNQELCTVANAGEVFPGATTPLSYSMQCSYISHSVYRFTTKLKEPPFVTKFLGSINHHVNINVTNCMLNKIGDKIDTTIRVTDMAVFGHSVVDEKIHAVAKSRFGTLSKLGRINLVVESFIETFKIDKYVKESIKIARQPKLDGFENHSAWEMVNRIKDNMHAKRKVFDYHTRTTNISVFYQFLAINILAEGSEVLTTDHYYDIAILLSSCSNVVSAEVPKTLENIGLILREAGLSQNFISVKPEKGVAWLRANCPRASDELGEFLNKHGHRGFREFEYMHEPWGQCPALIIEMLQANCKFNRISKPAVILTPEETIEKLITPKNNTIRKILKFLVKRCRKSVSQREDSKSEVIRIVNQCRVAIKTLAKQMVAEGIIPDPKLVYHFSLYELMDVIQNRDPSLLYKAKRRQRLHPQWDKLQIPELLFGFVKIEDDQGVKISLENGDGKKRLTGTPVFPGNVVARACVITTLDEIHQLQAGDILITHSTDVGWSPYFPILSAVVTELGGIISHGAVVAREYGLPCVVGVQNATKVFKTGDQVVLSGKLGLLEMANPNEQTNSSSDC